MRSIQMQESFPLSSVKPLEGLSSYRNYCLAATHQVCQGALTIRQESPVSGLKLEPLGEIDGLAYGICPESGSFFLTGLPPWKEWAGLLVEVNRYRHSPEGFHSVLSQSRTDHVYSPKLQWIEDTLRLQGLLHPRVLEVTTPPSGFTPLLREGGVSSQVLTVDEMELIHGSPVSSLEPAPQVQVGLLLESLDRVDDPAGLLRKVRSVLQDGGLLFVTALVSSGFDIAVLGLKNQYLYPPDRTNCFSLNGLKRLVQQSAFTLLEVSTPGVLDLEIVQAHLKADPSLHLSEFERQLIDADQETRDAFQAFLQQRSLSSFARIVARKIA